MRRHGLEHQAVEILAQEMVTDLATTFEDNSCMKMVRGDIKLFESIQQLLNAEQQKYSDLLCCFLLGWIRHDLPGSQEVF